MRHVLDVLDPALELVLKARSHDVDAADDV
jgi:hypothetical protein